MPTPRCALVGEFARPRSRSSSTPIRAASRSTTTSAEAYARALACDPVSAYGGIVALNRTLDVATAEQITQLFTEVVIAPDATGMPALLLAARPNLRLLLTGAAGGAGRADAALGRRRSCWCRSATLRAWTSSS